MTLPAGFIIDEPSMLPAGFVVDEPPSAQETFKEQPSFARALMGQAPADPRQTEAMGAGMMEVITGASRETEYTRALPEIGELGTGEIGKDFKVAVGLLAAVTPQDQMDVIKSVVPDAQFEQDRKGNIIVDIGGKQGILNKPGLSEQDALQLTAQVLAFVPAAKVAGMAKSLMVKMGLGGTTAAVTEAGIQEVAVAAGAEEARDPTMIALTGGLGALAETALPIYRTVKKLISPAPAVEETLATALKQGTVLTTDIYPPTTFVGKAFQKMTERVPLVGTGKIRYGQQLSRQEAMENLAREFDIDPSDSFEKKIIESANRVFKGAQKKAAKFRTEAVEELNKLGDITPNNAIKEIDDQINKISDLGARGDTALLEALQNIKGELAGNFERLKNIRTTIFDDIKDIGSIKSPIRSGGDSVLTRIAGALSKDMDDFAVTASKTKGASKELRLAANKWKASNRIFKDNFAKGRETELKRILTKGKVTPEVVNTVIKGGKVSELNRLYKNIDLKGRKSVRQNILKNALEKSGYPERLNPTVFLNELNRTNTKKAVNVFFAGKDKKALDGYKKFFDLTRRAQEEAASIATQQEATTIGLIGSTALAPKVTIAIAAGLGLSGRAFESKPIRNLLIKLSGARPGSKNAEKIMALIKPLVIAEGLPE